MYCKKCGKLLIGKQLSYCSPICSKLHLKSLYKKRNREKINKYNREYSKMGVRGNPCTNKILREHLKGQNKCQGCGKKDDLQVCHIKPRWAGGKNKNNLITFCRVCHNRFDNLLRDFWKKTL